LRHHTGALPHPVLTSWDFSGESGNRSFPALLELSAGYHSFDFVVTAGNFYFNQMNAFSL
jgi:hypothetical protein